jgi:uncharacterized protein YxjI
MVDNKAQYDGISNVFLHKNYVVRKKVFQIFGGSFHIYDPSGNVAFYSEQKAFKLREDIRLYTGEDKATEFLHIQARDILDFSAAYDVIDSSARMKVGTFRREGMKSTIRDEWTIMDAQEKEIGVIQEESLHLALLRRFLLDLIPQTYCGMVNGELVCLFKQNFNPFVGKINLDYSMDTKGLLDRRLGIAGAILLCAIEGKQS